MTNLAEAIQQSSTGQMQAPFAFSGSFGAVLMASLAASGSVGLPESRIRIPIIEEGTYSQHHGLLSRAYAQVSYDFTGELAAFYAQLDGAQQELAADISKIVRANMWELYEE
ncbi:MAG: hypothetical protein H6872_01265 [Methylobacteriaceae bacterium]|nr:hypothetical protein [Methylobacteriaceae bacterium]